MDLDQINIDNIRKLVADKLTEPILRSIEQNACELSSQDVEYKKPVNKSSVNDWTPTADRIVDNLDSRGFLASYTFSGIEDNDEDQEEFKSEITIVVENQWC
jgi:SOS response regulatory protein OraA/RecX